MCWGNNPEDRPDISYQPDKTHTHLRTTHNDGKYHSLKGIRCCKCNKLNYLSNSCMQSWRNYKDCMLLHWDGNQSNNQDTQFLKNTTRSQPSLQDKDCMSHCVNNIPCCNSHIEMDVNLGRPHSQGLDIDCKWLNSRNTLIGKINIEKCCRKYIQ